MLMIDEVSRQKEKEKEREKEKNLQTKRPELNNTHVYIYIGERNTWTFDGHFQSAKGNSFPSKKNREKKKRVNGG